MYMPHGFVGFREAIDMVASHELDFFPTVERLIRALASEVLGAFGVVVGAVDRTEEPKEMGEILALRPGIWRLPRTQDAAQAGGLNLQVHQDGLVLIAIFQETALLEWHKEAQGAPSPEITRMSIVTEPTPKLPCGKYRLEPGYVPFHEIPKVASAWAKSGLIDSDLLHIFDPPTSDSITEALAAGSLSALGVNEQTGAIVPLPASIWRAGPEYTPQSIWALRGDNELVCCEGGPCVPLVTEADLARAFNATSIPPDPPELPESWKPASAIGSTLRANNSETSTPREFRP
jgi:hypothetical protein